VAAAFAVASAPAAPPAAQAAPTAAAQGATAHHTAATAATTAAARSGPAAAAQLMSLARPMGLRAPVTSAARGQATATRAAAPARYTVKAGDTLSSIAGRVYHDPRYWTVLYQANHKQVRYANEITEGQVLTVPAKPAKIPAAPSVLGPAPVVSAPPAAVTGTYAGPQQAAPVQPAQASATVSTSGDGSFQSCVIARESGGNSQVMNASGHYGLYQFSASTWAAYGGSAADFGNASVAEQNQVFDSAIAAGGQSNWSAYDGC
jgi:LysM repeat protein